MLLLAWSSLATATAATGPLQQDGPCGLPQPPPPPMRTLLNNTRLNYPEPAGGPLTPFVCGLPEACLAACVNDTACGAMVFQEPYEPYPIGFGCDGKLPTDGCCYPAPVLPSYAVVPPGGYRSFGFVSAIVRYIPPAPPKGIPPAWEPTYAMNRSVSLYWRNATGLEPAEWYDGYGLVMLDWAHAAVHWINDFSPMDNAAALAEQCALIKARSPLTRCVVYRNTVIALNQHAHVSSVLDDPAFADFFLRFKAGATQTGACWGEVDPRQQGQPWDPIWPTPVVCAAVLPTDVHVPMCDKAAKPTGSKCNRVHYFDQNQVPQVPSDNWSNDSADVYQGLVCINGTGTAPDGSCNCGASPCGEYLFNFSNPSMVDWWLLEHMGGETALDHPDVDGLILDDYWSAGGPSEIDRNSLADMGMSTADAAVMTTAWSAAVGRLYDLAATREKFISDMGYNGDSLSYASAAQCASRLGAMCAADDPQFGSWYVVNYEYVPAPAYGVRAPNALLDVAYFLLTRGPYAWVAGGPMLGWHMSHWWAANQTRRIEFRTDLRPREFDGDYGEPTCSCAPVTGSPGVFVRYWTKANVTVDCNSLQGRIDVMMDS
jgi:hypothetical protein